MATVPRTAAGGQSGQLAALAPTYDAGLVAGTTIAPGDACYADPVSGLIYPSSGAAPYAPADAILGFADANGAAPGQVVKLYIHGAVIPYATPGTVVGGSVLVPGQTLYLSATTPGALDTAPTPGDPNGCAQVGADGGSIRILVRNTAPDVSQGPNTQGDGLIPI